jgi:hypothetical protein
LDYERWLQLQKKKEVENFIPQSGIGVFLLAMNSKKKI